MSESNCSAPNITPADPRATSMADFMYPLPDERIAKHPCPVRDECKLLVADADGVKADAIFRDIADFLPADSLLVCNNTRVINARVRMRKSTGALIEIFCLEPLEPADYERSFAAHSSCTWLWLGGKSKKWQEGALARGLTIAGSRGALRAERAALAAQHSESMSWAVTFSWNDSRFTFAQVIEAAGVIPIPPYLNRDTEDCDSKDYQTVFSRINGSVAAPTAGLHFTERVLASLADKGIERREVTLHVGAGTFQPVKSADIGGHRMHSEFIVVGRDLITELMTSPKRIIAVGTTSVRTLESLYHAGCLISQNRWDGEVPQWYPYEASHPHLSVKQSMEALLGWLDANHSDHFTASTRLIVAPGYSYNIVKGMVTNFHQPGSTLLLLVSAMIGLTWRTVYNHALASDYHFLSYGDACLFLPKL